MTDVCVLGAINLDLATYVDAIPRPGETVLARSSGRALGGKAANQAVASARLGAPTRLVGALGDDPEGDWLRAQLAYAGVRLKAVGTMAGMASGLAHVCVAANGENAIVVVAGANAALSAAAAAAAVRTADVRLAQLESPIACVAAFLAAQPDGAGLRLLNAAPALPEARRLFADVEVLVVNEHELATYLGRPVAGDPAQVAEAARALRSQAAQRVIVTLGAAGLVAVTGTYVVRVEGRKVEAVDTTGAGDCFCGALAACLSEGAALADALRRATVAAALSVTRRGAAASMPTAQEVDAALSA